MLRLIATMEATAKTSAATADMEARVEAKVSTECPWVVGTMGSITVGSKTLAEEDLKEATAVEEPEEATPTSIKIFLTAAEEISTLVATETAQWVEAPEVSEQASSGAMGIKDLLQYRRVLRGEHTALFPAQDL